MLWRKGKADRELGEEVVLSVVFSALVKECLWDGDVWAKVVSSHWFTWPSVSTYEEEGKSFNVDYLAKVIGLISLMKWLLYWNIL